MLRDITVETKPDPKNKSEWTLTVNAFVDATEPLDAIFDIRLDNNHLITRQKRSLKPTEGSARVKFEIPVTTIPIIPWFPNGVANNTQHLYRLNVSLSLANSSEQSVQSKRIGFRTVELVEELVKPEGRTF